MDGFLLFLVLGLFVALLFVNVYFRIKVIKHYRVLNKANISFGAKYIFNQQKLEQTVIPYYPEYKEDILGFAKHLRFSIKMASVLFALICLFGLILMKFR